MRNIITFTEFLLEQDGGGGVGFATANGNGAGNIVAPTVGGTPGSVWQGGSGQIGSGDVSAYDMGKKFGLVIDKEKQIKKKRKKSGKNTVRYFTKPF